MVDHGWSDHVHPAKDRKRALYSAPQRIACQKLPQWLPCELPSRSVAKNQAIMKRTYPQHVQTDRSQFSIAEKEEQSHWYAIYTYPRHEKAVTDALKRKELDVFLPTYICQSQWKDRRVKLVRPLFPSYLFARIQALQQIKVVTVPGVLRILSFQGQPAAVSDQEIDSIRWCMSVGAVLEPSPLPSIGERIRIRSGVFEGVEGTVSNLKNGCKLMISVSLINQSVAFEITPDQMERTAVMQVPPSS